MIQRLAACCRHVNVAAAPVLGCLVATDAPALDRDLSLRQFQHTRWGVREGAPPKVLQLGQMAGSVRELRVLLKDDGAGRPAIGRGLYRPN